MISSNKEVDFGINFAPRFRYGQPATTRGGGVLGINPSSSLEMQLAAANFLDCYLFSEDGGFVAADSSTDNAPTLEATRALFWERAAYSDPRLAGMKAIQAYQTNLVAQVRPKCVGAMELDQVMSVAIGDIINGADAKTTLDAANATLERVWRKYR
jgi:multiple sugar transport system substrate-binding protein